MTVINDCGGNTCSITVSCCRAITPKTPQTSHPRPVSFRIRVIFPPYTKSTRSSPFLASRLDPPQLPLLPPCPARPAWPSSNLFSASTRPEMRSEFSPACWDPPAASVLDETHSLMWPQGTFPCLAPAAPSHSLCLLSSTLCSASPLLQPLL